MQSHVLERAKFGTKRVDFAMPEEISAASLESCCKEAVTHAFNFDLASLDVRASRISGWS